MSAPQGHLPVVPSTCSYLGCSAPAAWLLLTGPKVAPWGFCEGHREEHMRFERATKSWREAFREGRAKWVEARVGPDGLRAGDAS